MDNNLLSALHSNPFVLAPMAGITDRPFRSFMREMGCGIVVTELVSATGLKYSSEKTRKLMAFDKIQHPIGIQLFGDTLEDLAYAAKEVEQMGADFVDLNFGCPVPKVVKKGGGAAILKDLKQLRIVLQTVKAAVTIPVTIKIRTGWDQETRNAHEVVQIAYDEGISWVAIHGRTRAQGYSGLSDWDYIRWVKSQAKLPVLGNGDIASGVQATSRLRESGCDGVLIGRGCLKNPWIYQQAMNALKGVPDLPVEKNFFSVFTRLKYHLEQSCDERTRLIQLKKFASWYSAGYPDSKEFRKNIFQSADLSTLAQVIDRYFESMGAILQSDTSSEPFLMGGHG